MKKFAFADFAVIGVSAAVASPGTSPWLCYARLARHVTPLNPFPLTSRSENQPYQTIPSIPKRLDASRIRAFYPDTISDNLIVQPESCSS